MLRNRPAGNFLNLTYKTTAEGDEKAPTVAAPGTKERPDLRITPLKRNRPKLEIGPPNRFDLRGQTGDRDQGEAKRESDMHRSFLPTSGHSLIRRAQVGLRNKPCMQRAPETRVTERPWARRKAAQKDAPWQEVSKGSGLASAVQKKTPEEREGWRRPWFSPTENQTMFPQHICGWRAALEKGNCLRVPSFSLYWRYWPDLSEFMIFFNHLLKFSYTYVSMHTSIELTSLAELVGVKAIYIFFFFL